MKFRLTLLTLAVVTTALTSTLTRALPSTLARRQSDYQGYYRPATNGGSMLTANTASGQGEPLNVIISGQSDPGVLNPAGFEEFTRSFYFSPGSCLNISQGGFQTANLGDGNGARPQTNIMRYNYKQGDGGSCIESLKGGNHFRYWIQNGTAANSGAIFIAASVELNATLGHMIAPNGYDDGRDELVGNATAGTLTSPGGFQYQVSRTANSQLLSGLSASQINHAIGIDGTVDVLTVKITKNGTIGATSSNSTTSNGGSISTPQPDAARATSDSNYAIKISAVALSIALGILILL